jgi:hypothetical protein
VAAVVDSLLACGQVGVERPELSVLAVTLDFGGPEAALRRLGAQSG